MARQLGHTSASAIAYHFRELAKAGVLTIVREEPVRGATKRFYAVARPDELIEELRGVTRHVAPPHVDALRGGWTCTEMRTEPP